MAFSLGSSGEAVGHRLRAMSIEHLRPDLPSGQSFGALFVPGCQCRLGPSRKWRDVRLESAMHSNGHCRVSVFRFSSARLCAGVSVTHVARLALLKERAHAFRRILCIHDLGPEFGHFLGGREWTLIDRGP